MDKSLFGTIGVGVGLFAATNVDDIFLLAAFFADPHLSPRTIVIGQFMGIAALVAVSSAAAMAAVIVPAPWIALLGVVPLLLGVRKLWQVWRSVDGDDNEGLREREQILERRSHSQVLAVAGVTVANGGDNLGVYVPLFAADVLGIPTYVVIFSVMTAAWCVAGHALVNNRVIGVHIRRYGHVLLPFVLLALGIMILRDAAPLFH